MYKTTVTYENYNGEKITEDLYFHLSRAEIIKLEMSMEGGLSSYIDDIISSGSRSKLFEMIEMFITKSYGIKSSNGNKFLKSDEILSDFMDSEAYSEFLMDVFKDDNSLANFFNGVFPKEIISAVSNNKEAIKDKMKEHGMDVSDDQIEEVIKGFKSE